MDSWELLATLGTTLAAWGAMLGLMWRMHTSVRREITGLRDEMRSEIASVRTDLGGEIAGLRDEMRSEFASVRTDLGGEIAGLRDEMRSEFASVRTDLGGEIAMLAARIATNEKALFAFSQELAEFRGEMRSELKGVNTALLVLREDFRAHVHGFRAG